MDIHLDNLGASSFSLELPANPSIGARTLHLRDVVGLRGGLHTEPGLVRLATASVTQGTIGGFIWPLGQGEIATAEPLAVTELAVNADFPSPPSEAHLGGQATASHVKASSFRLRMPTFDATTDATLSNLRIEAESGELSTRCELAKLHNLQLQVGGLLVRGAVDATNLRLESGGGGPLTVLSSALDALELNIVHPLAEISAAGIELSRGIAFKAGELRIDELHLGALRMHIPLEATEPTISEQADTERPRVHLVDDVVCFGDRRLLDLRDLDGVVGHAEISVFVKAQLPVVGSYTLDRTFKIPIIDGQVDFVDVERQLGTIEDAFIDFAVRDGELIIKRDIPLLPTKGKKLVYWPLSSVEESLAKKRRVSLRTLTRFQMAGSKDGDSKATIAEVKIDIPALSVTLPPAPEDNGGNDSNDAEIEVRGFEPLSMAGSLRLSASDDARELDASVRGNRVSFGLGPIALGDRLLAARAVRCGEIHVSIGEWDGLKPRAIDVELKDLWVEGLTVRAAKPR